MQSGNEPKSTLGSLRESFNKRNPFHYFNSPRALGVTVFTMSFLFDLWMMILKSGSKGDTLDESSSHTKSNMVGMVTFDLFLGFMTYVLAAAVNLYKTSSFNNQNKEIEQLLLQLQTYDANILDHIIANGELEAIGVLKKVLALLKAENNNQNVNGACLIPFLDELVKGGVNVGVLESHDLILHWDQLEERIKKGNPSFDEAKRLHTGLKRLIKAWSEGWLRNKKTEQQLCERQLQVLIEKFDDIKTCPEVVKQLRNLREFEIEQWIKGYSKRQDELDGIVRDRILRSWWLQNNDSKDPLFVALEDIKRSLLLKAFKGETLPKGVQTGLNQENLCGLIYETIEQQGGSVAFQKFVIQKICEVEEQEKGQEKKISPELIQEKIANDIYSMWLEDELVVVDSEVSELIDEMGCKLLREHPAVFDKEGSFLADIQNQTVDALLCQFQQQELKPQAKKALKDKILVIFEDMPYTDQQKEVVLKEIQKEFKKGKEKTMSERLEKVCTSFLNTHLNSLSSLSEKKRRNTQTPTPHRNNRYSQFVSSGEIAQIPEAPEQEGTTIMFKSTSLTNLPSTTSN